MPQRPPVNVLLSAAALQDHLSRLADGRKAPSLRPGAKLTLAQQLGLVPRPAALLTPEEWEAVHAHSRARQESSTDCCAICLAEFREEPQVLLSCSHVLHKACLASFERHARTRCCPLCRQEGYQKRAIRDAAEAYRHRCATVVQAAVRGWLARRRVWELRRHRPPTDVRLKRQWGAARLQEESDKLLHRMDRGASYDLDQLLNQADQSLEASRQVADSLALRLQRGAALDAQAGGDRGEPAAWPPPPQQQQSTRGAQEPASHARQPDGGQYGVVSSSGREGPARGVQASRHGSRTGRGAQAPPSAVLRQPADWVRSQPLSSSRRQAAHVSQLLSASRGRQRALDASRQAAAAQQERAAAQARPPQPPHSSTVDWDRVLSTACQRAELDCAICLSDLVRPCGSQQAQQQGSQQAPPAAQQQGLAVLSCSHVLHVACIAAFERFSTARGVHATCPVCREPYERRCFAA